MDPVANFQNLLLMAASDGRMTESELRLLSHRAAEWGITDDQFEDAIDKALSGQAKLTLPPERTDRIQLLKELIRMMAADGVISGPEKQFFAVASSVLGLSADEINQLIDEVLAEDG